MSWGGSVGDVEGALEQCGIGKDPEERKKIARELFDIGRDGLTKALRSAPEILFVAAAGNENSDAGFAESIPAAIDAPNLLAVGRWTGPATRRHSRAMARTSLRTPTATRSRA